MRRRRDFDYSQWVILRFLSLLPDAVAGIDGTPLEDRSARRFLAHLYDLAEASDADASPDPAQNASEHTQLLFLCRAIRQQTEKRLENPLS